jgi:phage FluMu protein Com
MHCQNCHHLLGASHAATVICPHCHHVNHIRHSRATRIHRHIVRARYNPHFRRKVPAVLIGLLVSIFLLQNLLALQFVNQAANLDKQGSYMEVQPALQKVPSGLVLPGLKNKARAEAANNKRWLVYTGYQDKAEKLISEDKYQAALDELQKIGKDFPTYQRVAIDIDAANQHITTLQAVKVAAVKATKARRAAPPPGTKLQPNDCSLPGPISGKRYVSTDDFSAISAATSKDQVEQELQHFFNQYGLNLRLSNVSGDDDFLQLSSMSYAPVGDSDICNLRSTAMMLLDEWSKYPKDWVADSNLKTVVLIKDMKRTLSSVTYPVSATYDLQNSQMWYDISYGGDYMREVIHHEYYHYLVYNYTRGSAHDDNAWLSYNLPNFQYGKGGPSCYDPSSNCLTGDHPIPGFVTGYAASALAEDQAESYAYLMTGTYSRQLKAWVATDPWPAKSTFKNNFWPTTQTQ